MEVAWVLLCCIVFSVWVQRRSFLVVSICSLQLQLRPLSSQGLKPQGSQVNPVTCLFCTSCFFDWAYSTLCARVYACRCRPQLKPRSSHLALLYRYRLPVRVLASNDRRSI